MNHTFFAGAGKAEYTPTPDMLPVKLFFSPGNRNPFTGVWDPTFARAIMISDGSTRAVIISVEMPAPPETDKWMYCDITPAIAKVSEAFDLPEDHIFLVATHAHSVPGVGDVPPQATDEAKAFDAVYSQRVYQAILDAVQMAQDNLRPARIGIGKGTSDVNRNRYRMYYPTDGRDPFFGEGPNSFRYSDKTVFTIRIEDLDKNPIAFYINYAVHGTIMMGNTMRDGGALISADIGGVVSTQLEKKYPGSVALWVPAPCADQFPAVMTEMSYVNPETGQPEHIHMKESDKLLKFLGMQHYDDVARTLEQAVVTDRDTTIRCAVDWSVTPGRSLVFNEPGRPWSGIKEIITEGAPDIRIRLQLLRIGDIALIGTSGELYTSLGHSIRDASPLADTCVTELCASRIPGYVLDDEAINAGAMTNIQAGYLSGSLARVTKGLFKNAK